MDNSEQPKLRAPTFRNYIFRKPPPVTLTAYFPMYIQPNSKCCGEISKLCSYHYTPAYDPPSWLSTQSFKELKKAEEKIVDQLTMESLSKGSFPLFDFTGDFFVKFIVLECYGIFYKNILF